MSTIHLGECPNCGNKFEVTIEWKDNDEGDDITDITPPNCPKCGSNFNMKFDTDPKGWIGVYGTN